MDVRVFVGRRIRRRRRLMDMTQQELGEACGVTFQTIQKYESASTRLSVDMLWKLAGALKVDVVYFFTGLAEQVPAAALANDDSVAGERRISA